MCERSLYTAFLALILLFSAGGVWGDGVWEGQIADENDDVEQRASSMYMDSSDLEMVDDSNVQVGLRFVNVTVPPGSAISNAYIEFHVDQIDADQPVNLIIQGELSPNAAQFTSSNATDVIDRPRATAQVRWSPEYWPTVDETRRTVDISPIIEEIVNQTGWRSGNALVLIIIDDPDNPATGFRTARGGPGDDSALLHIEYGPAVKAKQPYPPDGQTDVLRDTDLSWLPGAFAGSHDVYLGTDIDAISSVSQGQAAATYDPGRLEFGQTYYWRIDEVNSTPDQDVHQGDVWSFTVEPFVYPVENVIATAFASDPGSGPENIVNVSGLNANDEHSTESADMWSGTLTDNGPVWVQFDFDTVYKLHEMLVWNYNVQFEAILGFGLNAVTVEYSENGVDWTVLGDLEIAKATSMSDYTANTTIDFGGAPVKHVRLTATSNHGMLNQYGLSEVRFLYIPANARYPDPADGAVDVSVATTLEWRAGREAASHEVYFGTDPDALTLGGTANTPSYTPGALDMDTSYSWQIVEVNEAEAISVWPGSVWNFTTQAFVVVDDFESYDNTDNVIYDTWIDGWVNGTGSTVGHLVEPFAETTIVRSGTQSMPLFYDNVGVETAEAVRDLSQDWTAHGIKSLSLYFYGDTANSGGQLFVKINNSKIVYDGPAVNIRRPSWQLWNIDLSTAGNVSNVNSLTIGVEGSGAQGVLYIDDIRLYPEVIDDTSPDITGAGDTVQGVPNDADWPAGEEPPNAVDDDVSTKYLHRKGGSMATGFQVEPMVGATLVTGLTFTTANDVPTRDPIAFELSGSNTSIDGPYTLIASGDIVDFAGATDWPRFTKTVTPITFENTVAYTYYQIVFPDLRGAAETLMQIAEVELLGEIVP